MVLNCKIVSSVLESVNYAFTISPRSPLPLFPGNAHLQHSFSSPTHLLVCSPTSPHRFLRCPFFSLAPAAHPSSAPHTLHTTPQLLASSSSLPLMSSSRQSRATFCGAGKRGHNVEAPAPAPGSPIPGSSGKNLELQRFSWASSVVPAREVGPSSPSPTFTHTELAFVFVSEHAKRLCNI